MSFIGLLGHRATIQARTTRRDRFNQPLDAWEDKATDVPCRLTNPSGGETYTDRSRNVVKADHVLFFGPDVVIGELDRVGQVVDADGVVLARDLDVLLVRPAGGFKGTTHHLEVPCVAFRGSAGG